MSLSSKQIENMYKSGQLDLNVYKSLLSAMGGLKISSEQKEYEEYEQKEYEEYEQK